MEGENPGGQEEGAGEEGEKVRIRRIAGLPTQEEIDEENVDHAENRVQRSALYLRQGPKLRAHAD
jgi:hypothetical protein